MLKVGQRLIDGSTYNIAAAGVFRKEPKSGLLQKSIGHRIGVRLSVAGGDCAHDGTNNRDDGNGDYTDYTDDDNRQH